MLQRRIQFSSVPENIRLVEDFILEIHSHVRFDESILDRVMISVTEAANNAIEHGNGGNPMKTVTIESLCYDHELVFTVEDEGGGFVPEELPDPLADDNLLKEGGRGILIIRSMMDSVTFERTNSGMKLHLSVRL